VGGWVGYSSILCRCGVERWLVMKVVSIQLIAHTVLDAQMIPVVGHSLGQIEFVELKCGHIVAGSVE
jgi:hypothetical protein